MSEDLFNAFHQHDILSSQGSGSAHDHLADSLRSTSAHDELSDRLARHPYSLDAHPTDYQPPLEHRTESDYASLPPQPEKIDAGNAWDYMKKSYHDIWHSGDAKNHWTITKAMETAGIPAEAIANSLAKATHADIAKSHDTLGQYYNILGKVGPPISGEKDAAYYGRIAAAWVPTLLLDPVQYLGIGPTSHAEEAMNALKMAEPAALTAEAALKGTPAIASMTHAPALTQESIRNTAVPMLLQQRMGKTIEGLEETFRSHPDPAVREKANGMISELSGMQSHLARGGSTPEYTALRDSLRAKSEGPIVNNDEWTKTPWGVSNKHLPDIPKVSKDVDPTAAAFDAAGHFLTNDKADLTKLARQQVLKERQVEHGLPALRFMGGKTPIPSPFPVAGKVAGRALGKYTEQTGLSGTTKQLEDRLEAAAAKAQLPGYKGPPMVPGVGKAFSNAVKFVMPKDYIKRLTGGEDHGQMPVSKVYDYLNHLQQGSAVQDSHQGIGFPLKGLLHAKEQGLNQWFERFTQHWDLQHREEAAKSAQSLYQGLGHAMDLEPNLRLRNTPAQIKSAARALQDYGSSHEFRNHYLSGPATPNTMTYPEQAAAKWKSAFPAVFDHNVPGSLMARQRDFDIAAHENDPNKFVQAVTSMRNFFTGQGADSFKSLDAHLHGAMTALHDVYHTQTPFDVQQKILQDAPNYQKEGRQGASMSQSMNAMIDSYLRSQTATGLEMLGRVDNSILDSAKAQYGPPVGHAVGQTPEQFLDHLATSHGFSDREAMAGDVKRIFGNELDQMVKDGRHTPETAKSAKEFLYGKPVQNPLTGAMEYVHQSGQGLNALGLYHATNLMKDVAAARKDALRWGPTEELRQMGGENLIKWIAGLREMDSHIMERRRLPFESTWNHVQWTHDPNKLGRYYNKYVEPITNAVLRNHGWPQRLIEAFHQWDGTNQIAKNRAESKALGELHGKVLPDAVAGVLGRAATHDQLNAIDDLFTRYEDYGPGRMNPIMRERQIGLLANELNRGNPNQANIDQALAKTTPDGLKNLLAKADQAITYGADRSVIGPIKRQLRIDQIAREEFQTAEQGLEGIFGKGNAKKAADAIMNAYETHITNPTMEKEIAAGQTVIRRGRYIPRYKLGSWQDKRELSATLQRMKDKNLHPAEFGNPEKPLNAPAVTGDAAYEEKRVYPSAAHHRYDIEEVNKYRSQLGPADGGPKPHLDVKMDHSLASRTMMRHIEHQRSLASIELIHQLSDILPGHVQFFLPPRAGSNIMRGMQRAENMEAEAARQGYMDVGDLAPQLKGWKVSPKLHKYMSSYVDRFEDPSGSEEVTNIFQRPFNTLMRFLKFANVGFSGTHIRNVAANSLVSGGPAVFKRAAELISEAAKGYAAEGPGRWFSPMIPLARALEKHPLYDKGVRYGLFRSGAEYELPAQDLIRMRMNPQGLGKSVLGWAKNRVGPWNTVTFDVFDRALRMAMFEKYLKTGMTEARAAEQANFRMIDYTMRHITPSSRKVLQSIMPFPAWSIGNLMLHGKQMVQNPFYYALVARATEAINNHEDGVRYPKNPDLVAGAIAMKHTIPGSSAQTWTQPHFPWMPEYELEKGVTDELLRGHPLVAGKIAGKYVANRLYDFPFDLKSMFQMRGGPEGEEKRSLGQELVGKQGSPDAGVLGNMLWGLDSTKLPEFFRDWIESGKWNPQPEWQKVRLPLPGADVRGALESQFGTVEGVTPQGKVQY
jgi:hypothetical protein